ERIETVLGNFEAEAAEQSAFTADAGPYLRNVLTKALGQEKAGFVLERILSGSDTSGIDGLKWMDAASVAELVKNEHPQIVASVLVHLERDHASEVLAQFPERLRND